MCSSSINSRRAAENKTRKVASEEIKARSGLRTFAFGGGGPLATSGKWVKFID
jgi:hypothetical protein